VVQRSVARPSGTVGRLAEALVSVKRAGRAAVPCGAPGAALGDRAGRPRGRPLHALAPGAVPSDHTERPGRTPSSAPRRRHAIRRKRHPLCYGRGSTAGGAASARLVVAMPAVAMPAVPMPAVPMPAVPRPLARQPAALAAAPARLVFAALLLVAGVTSAAAAPPPPATPPPLVDLDGRPADPLADGAAATVFLFVRTDCPISNRYAPEVRRLWQVHAPRGAAFYLVYPDPGEPVADIRRSTKDFGYPFPALRDPEHRLVARTGATVTPEAAVYDAAGRMVYRGRIDDRWAGLGRPRAAPTRRDLDEVLAALLAGERMVPRTTRAVGCFIPELAAE
jgi:hypothetical protein